MKQVLKLDGISINIIFFCIFILLLARIMDLLVIYVISKYILVLLLSSLLFLIILKERLNVLKIKVILPLIAFNLIYIIQADNIDTLAIILNHFVFFIVFYFFGTIEWSEKHLRKLSLAFFFIIPVLLIMSFIFTDKLNTNTIGAYTYLLAFFPLLYSINLSIRSRRNVIYIVLILSFTIILTSESRAILVSIIVSLVTLLIWKYLSSNKILYNLYFICIIFSGYWFTVVWPKAYTWRYFDQIEFWSFSLTGKSLLSGRERIWERLIAFIKEKPILGHGASITPEHLTNITFSSHNTYIQISLQVGLMGLFFLILFLYLIWRKLWNNRFDYKVKLVASYFIGIIIYQLFEVTLTQNQFGLGLLQWIIIGIGFSLAKENKTNSSHNLG